MLVMSSSITPIRGSKMGDTKYRDKVEQNCPKCEAAVLALRLNAFYAGSRERVFLWECPVCAHIWRKVRPKLKSEPLVLDSLS